MKRPAASKRPSSCPSQKRPSAAPEAVPVPGPEEAFPAGNELWWDADDPDGPSFVCKMHPLMATFCSVSGSSVL